MAVANSVAQYNENAGATYHARDLRRERDKLLGWDVRVPNAGSATSGLGNGGVARYYGAATTGDLAVVQRGAGANMSVDVGAGGAAVGGTEAATQGEYFVFNDATVNVVISASDPSNPRIDVIGIQIRDKEYSGATDDARILVITGTPAASPAVPTLPADFLSLAHVAVAAAAASIVTANITDKRRNLTSLGGVIIADSSSVYPTVNLWEGMVLWDRTLDCALIYSGAAWIQIGPLAVWSTWVPTITALAGTITTVGALIAHYMRVGRGIWWWESVTITTIGTASGALITTLPVTASTSAAEHVGSGRNQGTGRGVEVALNSSTTALWVYSSDNGFTGGSGGVDHLSGFFESAS